MIDALRDLCAVVLRPTSAEAAAHRLGPVVADEGGLTAIRVKPSASEFSEARVVRRPDGSLSHVDVTLARPGSLRELVSAFGEPSRPPRAPHGNSRLAFRSGDCVLIAEVSDDRDVISVSVRSESD